MLQQTQVERVIPKYKAFLKKYPTLQKVALADEIEVLRLWQGLGYNRRARNLLRTAIVIKNEYKGTFPQEYGELLRLPGIGPYTASALQVFAFNKPVVLIETNIRAVFLDCFFEGKKKVADAQLLPHIERTIDRLNPRKWYSALMDYGAMLKRTKSNPSRRSTHHVKQKPFVGSVRFARGRILKELLKSTHNQYQINDLKQIVNVSNQHFTQALKGLTKEHFIKVKNKTVSLMKS